MGFFNKVGGFFSKVGKGIGKAFGVVTAPVKEVYGFLKDTVQTIVHMPLHVLKSVDKATGVIGGLGKNVENSVGSAAGAVTSIGHDAASIAGDMKGALGGLGGNTVDLANSPMMWGALGIAALFILKS